MLCLLPGYFPFGIGIIKKEAVPLPSKTKRRNTTSPPGDQSHPIQSTPYHIKMEVASPLPFGHVKAGSKRRFATCSPLDAPIEAHVDDYAMDESAAYGSSFKRRRCGDMEMSVAPSATANAPFGSAPSPQQLPAFGKSGMDSRFLGFNHDFRTWD